VVVHAYNPSPQQLRQEDYKFKASLGYMVRPSLEKKKKEEKERRNYDN
jgi:hypothetical protein